MNWLTFIKRLSKKPSRETAKSLDLRLLSRSRPLSQDILDCAQVLTDRIELLSRLPKNGAVAEIGVAKGDFSENILRINSPRKLFLIDAWHMEGQSSYGESGFIEVQSRFCDAI